MKFADHILFRNSLTELKSILQDEKVFVIIDRKVEALYGFEFPYRKVYVDAGEDSKNLETVSNIVSELLKLGADRNCLLLGIGGGTVTDITGFVAAIYKRGVRYALIPTSLLAMVDAAIGGKTGINFNSYKNILGVFNTPEFVYDCSYFLKTLPEREFLCGAAEMLKIFLITSGAQFRRTVKFFAENKQFTFDNQEDLESLVLKAVKAKCKIVDADFKEKGSRRVLNLGHTFAHGIEHAGVEGISHGEAVSIGTVMAAKIACRLDYCSERLVKQITSSFEKVGLPTSTDVNVNLLFEAIEKDKKREDDTIHFVMPTSLGSVRVEQISITQLKGLAQGL